MKTTLIQITTASIFSLVMAFSVASAATNTEVQREERAPETDQLPALKKQASNTPPNVEDITHVARHQSLQYDSGDFWIYDTYIDYNVDFDYDGYYSAFTLALDADTVYSSAPVYFIAYIGDGDYFDAFHVSSVFYLNGDTTADTFYLDNTLLAGYPSGDYEILVELYDAYDDTLVAYADGYTDNDLMYVPLESDDYEYQPSGTVVVVEEYGGSLHWLMLIVLGGIVATRVTRRH